MNEKKGPGEIIAPVKSGCDGWHGDCRDYTPAPILSTRAEL